MKRCLTALLLTTALLSTSLLAQETTTVPATQTTTKPTPPVPPKKAKVALLRLSDTLLERPRNFSFSLSDFTSTDKSPSLSSLIVTLNKAVKDPALAGLVVDLSSFDLSLNQAQELGHLFKNLREAKKRVAIYASDFDTATYILASHADTILMPENGNVLVPGVGLQMIFFHKALTYLHLEADFIQVGKFKGAEEPFTRDTASPEYREQITRLVDGMYTQIISTLVKNRPNMSEDDIKKAIDAGWLSGKRALEIGLVDKLLTRDKLKDWTEAQFPNGATLDDNYGKPPKRNLDLNNPFAIFSLLTEPPKPRSHAPAVAVLYAVGQIVPDFSGGEDSSSIVTPGAIRKAVEAAMKDDNVKAIVLRIDSPGGSASASDEIWAVLKDADKKKPVTVSMGRLAASGGYYIACAGRTITADPATITGSIGVVAGKLVIKGATDNLGINIETVARGQHAQMLSMLKPFSEEEREFLKKSMEETYAVFTSRVTAARGAKVAKLEDVAQGRLFTGEQAKDAGLVDKVGTLNEAVLDAAKDAGIADNYQIQILPEPRNFADILREGLMNDASVPIGIRGLDLSAASALINSLPTELRTHVRRAMDMVNLLQNEHMLMALPSGLIETSGGNQ